MVLQRAGDDLRGGGRVAVGEDDDRERRRERIGLGDVALIGFAATAHRGELGPAWEEEVGEVERLVEEATGVATEVDHEAGRALGLQAAQVLGELTCGGLVELLERDVGGLPLEHQRVRDGGDADSASGELDLEWRVDAGAGEARLDARARRALQSARDLIHLPPARARGVDTDDAVAFTDAGFFGRRVGVDLGDHDRALLILDQHADAAVEPTGVLVERLKVLRRVELGIGILEFRDEAARRTFVERADPDRVDEAVGDDRHHLVEELGAVGRGAFLHDEGTGGHGDGDQGSDSECAGPEHAGRPRLGLLGNVRGLYPRDQPSGRQCRGVSPGIPRSRLGRPARSRRGERCRR